MKETCGYLDSKGRFHKTVESCEKAELEIRIEKLRNQLENFHTELSQYFGRYYSYQISNRAAEYGLEIVAKCVLENSNMFLEIIAKKAQYKKDLDILEKQYKESTYKPWYLKFKWWE